MATGNNIVQPFWTQNVTDSISFDGTEGITILSVLLISGTGTLTGSDTVGGSASQALALQTGIAITLTGTGNFPISGITITASGGTVQLIGRK